jgi:hypothetical protein
MPHPEYNPSLKGGTHMFKKFSIVFGLMAAVAVSMPAPQAQAGVLITTKGIERATQGTAIDVIYGAGWISLGAAVIMFGADNYLASSTFAGQLGSIMIIALDANASLSQDMLEKGFSAAFPFIDNAEVISDLAAAVKTKANGKTDVMVSLSVEETQSILSATDLSAEQIQTVVSSLN